MKDYIQIRVNKKTVKIVFVLFILFGFLTIISFIGLNIYEEIYNNGYDNGYMEGHKVMWDTVWNQIDQISINQSVGFDNTTDRIWVYKR